MLRAGTAVCGHLGELVQGVGVHDACVRGDRARGGGDLVGRVGVEAAAIWCQWVKSRGPSDE